MVALLPSLLLVAAAQAPRLAEMDPFTGQDAARAVDGRAAVGACYNAIDDVYAVVYIGADFRGLKGLLIDGREGRITATTEIKAWDGSGPRTPPQIAHLGTANSYLIAWSSERSPAPAWMPLDAGLRATRDPQSARQGGHRTRAGIALAAGAGKFHLAWSGALDASNRTQLWYQFLAADGFTPVDEVAVEEGGFDPDITFLGNRPPAFAYLVPGPGVEMARVTIAEMAESGFYTTKVLDDNIVAGRPRIIANAAEGEYFVTWSADERRSRHVRIRPGFAVRTGEGGLDGGGDLFPATPAAAWNPASQRFVLAWGTLADGDQSTFHLRQLPRAGDDPLPVNAWDIAGSSIKDPLVVSGTRSTEVLLIWGGATNTGARLAGHFHDCVERPSVSELAQSVGSRTLENGALVRRSPVRLEGRLHGAEILPELSWRIEFELRPEGEPFTGTATAFSPATDGETAGAAVEVDLDHAISYRWQARAVDSDGRSTGWTPFPSIGAAFGTVVNRPPTLDGLRQRSGSSRREIPPGGSLLDLSVIFEATVSDLDGDAIELEVEVVRVDGSFGGDWVAFSPPTVPGGVARVEVPLAGNASYRWRARAVDPFDGTSDWTEFPGAASGAFTLRSFGSMNGASPCSPAGGRAGGLALLALVLLHRPRGGGRI